MVSLMSEVETEILAALVKSHNAQLDYIRKLELVVEAAKSARKSKVLRRSGYYDVSQFDEVFAEFDRLMDGLEGK